MLRTKNRGSQKTEKNTHDLYDLEKEEDGLDFTTYVRLDKALGSLCNIELLKEYYEPIEKEKPSVKLFEKLEIIGKDRKGQIYKMGAVEKGLLREERLGKLPRNADLIHLCNVSNSKVYYNIPKDEFWIEVYQPMWVHHKRLMKKIGSIKLEEHDIETLEAFSVAHRRGFCNPIPNQIWIRKRLKQKMKRICKLYNERVG